MVGTRIRVLSRDLLHELGYDDSAVRAREVIVDLGEGVGFIAATQALADEALREQTLDALLARRAELAAALADVEAAVDMLSQGRLCCRRSRRRRSHPLSGSLPHQDSTEPGIRTASHTQKDGSDGDGRFLQR